MNILAQDFGDLLFGRSSGGSHGSVAGFQSLYSIGQLVTLFINISLVVAGIILFFYFIVGGIGVMSSAGQADSQKAEQSKKTLTSALIGFVVVLASYWIVSLISELLGIQVLQNLF